MESAKQLLWKWESSPGIRKSGPQNKVRLNWAYVIFTHLGVKGPRGSQTFNLSALTLFFFFFSHHQYLLSIYSVLGTIEHTENIVPALEELIF